MNPSQKAKGRKQRKEAPQRIKRSSKTPQASKASAKRKAPDSRSEVIAKERARPQVGIPFHATSPIKLAALTALRDAHPGGSVKAQQERLEMALRRWPLTFQEMWALGLQDGRARIYGLRQRGLDIMMVWVAIETAYGQRHRVGLYSLRRGGTVPAPQQRQPDLFNDSPSAGTANAEALDQETAA
ncbi:MAG: helix-turn-helix domain-containing protein [Aquabacterium sp.]|uniref:helix-turn-helix domain-containing protein n=1 Tax=Aquabacterium sp. TaxID=1872578 RepID=UPI003BB10912